MSLYDRDNPQHASYARYWQQIALAQQAVIDFLVELGRWRLRK